MKRLALLEAMLIAALMALPTAAQDGGAQDGDGGAASSAGEVVSPWYLERGTGIHEARPTDDVPDVVFDLAALMRDGGVPGFYDGQFALTADRPDQLARLAGDPAVSHVLRQMAVMALQEALDPEQLRVHLEPLIMPASTEFQIEHQKFRERYAPSLDPGWVRQQLDAELSRYAHFALAKSGVARFTIRKIAHMELYVRRSLHLVLDNSLDSQVREDVEFGRDLVFDIAYHYQQFDDFDNAARWFRMLTDNLEGRMATRWAHYNLACISALQSRPEEAVAHLEEAWNVGFMDIGWMDEDGDLDTLRGRPDFEALRDRIVFGQDDPVSPDTRP